MGTIQEYFVESTTPSQLSERFQEFYANGELLDMTLVCKNGSVRAHKVVVAAQSKFFEDILIANPCKNPVIVMIDMDIDTLKCLVDYMYQSKITLKSAMLESFVKAANTLGLNSMIHAVDEQSKGEVTDEVIGTVDEYSETAQEEPNPSNEMLQGGQLVQVQTMEGNSEESFITMESNEEVGQLEDVASTPPARTIIISNRYDSPNTNQRARIICRKRRFDVVALRGRPSESNAAPYVVSRRDNMQRIESGMISYSPTGTIESLDEMVGVHFKLETDANGVKIHQCLLCPHTSSFPSNMKRHIMGHLGIKPYKCGYCEFQSTLRGDLNVHMKKKHPDDKGQGIIILK